MKFTANMGSADRIIRLVVAALLVILNLTGVVTGALAVVLWIFAAVFAVTAFIAFCPLYLPFGLSTRAGKQ